MDKNASGITSLQARIRGDQDRTNYYVMYAAAVRIQSAFRGALARRGMETTGDRYDENLTGKFEETMREGWAWQMQKFESSYSYEQWGKSDVSYLRKLDENGTSPLIGVAKELEITKKPSNQEADTDVDTIPVFPIEDKELADQWTILTRRLLQRKVPTPGSIPHEILKSVRNQAKVHECRKPATFSDKSTLDSGAISSQYIMNGRKNFKQKSLKSSLENLPNDTTSRILSYLQPHDLFHVALISKSGWQMFQHDLLWEWKYRDRWNCSPDGIHVVGSSVIAGVAKCGVDGDNDQCEEGGSFRNGNGKNGFWKRCYINAHCHPHDLWIRHWNCIYPEDVTTCPGRTVIPDVEFREGWQSNWQKQRLNFKERKLNLKKEQDRNKLDGSNINATDARYFYLQKNFDSPSVRQCPTCRYHPMLHPFGYNDVFEAIDAEMKFNDAQKSSAISSSDTKEFNINHQSANVDPVESAEVVAAAHALLSNSTDSINPRKGISGITSTAARTVHYSTLYSLAKWCRNMRLEFDDNIGVGEKEECDGGISLKDRYFDLMQKNEYWDESTCSADDYDLAANQNQSQISSRKQHHLTEFATDHPIRRKAQFAFECASTYNRHLQTSQYRSSGVNFLTDALFFNIHPSYEKQRSSNASLRKRLRENNESRKPSSNAAKHHSHLDELLKDRSALNSTSDLGSTFEESYHSWHVIRLTNPDFTLPITFRAYVQRPESFAVFPSEGFVRPGETIYLTLGVRTNGSLTNEAFEQIDVEREEIDPVFAKLYSLEGHPPFVPFAIRYMFAPMSPTCLPRDFVPRTNSFSNRSSLTPASLQQSDPTKFPSVVDHLWDNVTAEADVRTIYISAHINSNYGLDEFRGSSLIPFLPSQIQCDGNQNQPAAFMPNLQQKSSKLFSLVNNMNLETEYSYEGESYRTESPCATCKRKWGPRSEELGRAYILRRLECETHEMIRAQQQNDFERILLIFPSMLKRLFQRKFSVDEGGSGVLQIDEAIARFNRVIQLLFCLHTDFLLQKRADKLVTRRDHCLHMAYEFFIDQTYSDVWQCNKVLHLQLEKMNEVGANVAENQHSTLLGPKRSYSKSVLTGGWRTKGIFENKRCSQWILRNPNSQHFFKPEPDYLNTFGLLDYNPGLFLFNIGRQDDPNHTEDDCAFDRQQPPWHTDIFRNDAFKGLVSAVAMMSNPSALVGHGVYDRVKKPGSVIRCPSHPVSIYFRSPDQMERNRRNLLQKATALVNEWTIIAHHARFQQQKNINVSQPYFGWKGINIEMNEPDPDGFSLIVIGDHHFEINFQTTMAHFICNVPLPGQGQLLLSSPQGNRDSCNFCLLLLYTQVQPYEEIIFPSRPGASSYTNPAVMDTSEGNSVNQTTNQENDEGQGVLLPELNIVWLLARYLGWTVDDEENRGALFVDRRILIATQWFSNTIMVFSLLASLLSRKFLILKTTPIDLYFFGNSVQKKSNDMRYLTSKECGVAAAFLFVYYFLLGRMSERHIGRTYERELSDAVPSESPSNNAWLMTKFLWHLCEWTQRRWDSACPLFLQRHLFMPAWNKRTYQDVMYHVIYHRSKDFREHRSSFDAVDGIGGMPVNVSYEKLGFWSYFVGLVLALLSFSACSPHFVVNSLTVFCCSLSYGMSMSLESLETARRTTSTGVLSMVKPRRLNSLVIGFILVGQLVGSSGGILFLAEFIVTTVSLLLGGAATITSRALESWITFFCLASTAFWGYVFARLGLLDGMRKKRCGVPSLLLCLSLWLAFLMWILILTHVDWNALSPGNLIMSHFQQMVSGI